MDVPKLRAHAAYMIVAWLGFIPNLLFVELLIVQRTYPFARLRKSI